MTKSKKDYRTDSECHLNTAPILEGTSSYTMAAAADVHTCYEEAVQDVKQEVLNIYNFYMEMREFGVCPSDANFDYFEHRTPLILREDFCGTAILCKEWVKKNVMRSAVGVDLDSKVLRYAADVTFEGSIPDNVQLINEDVINVTPEFANIAQADVVTALNYSMGYFHTFSKLVAYFKAARRGLAPGGVFICDMFSNACVKGKRPGNFCFSRQCSSFTYHFEQTSLDVSSNTCYCHINFLFTDGSWLRRVFSYHFRIWTIAELKDALGEAGFSFVEIWFYSNDTPKEHSKLTKLKGMEKSIHSLLIEKSVNFYVVAG